jgi:hypothetical protein
VNRRLAIGAVVLLLAASVGCVTGRQSSLATQQRAVRRSGVTDFSSEGGSWFIGVSVRAARLAGPQEMLPLNLVLVNKKAGNADVGRESFALETPDGRQLPVVSYDEFEREYRRDRSDVRAGEEYVERFTQRFSAPPYTWRRLEFFPPRNSPTVPRDSIGTRNGELLHGYLYFRAPAGELQFPQGEYRLLFRPFPGGETFVVELFPF